MTVCLILAIFLVTYAAQPIAPEDSIKQRPLAIPQAVCPPDPTTVQQQFKELASTSGTKNPKRLGKREISESTAEHGKQSLLFCLWYNISIHETYGRKKSKSIARMYCGCYSLSHGQYLKIGPSGDMCLRVTNVTPLTLSV